MFKKLNLRITTISASSVILIITDQTSRGRYFNPLGEDSRFFSDSAISKDIRIISDGSPQWLSDTLFVRGSLGRLDMNRIDIHITRIMPALNLVLAYNQRYNRNKLQLCDVVEGLDLLEEEVCLKNYTSG